MVVSCRVATMSFMLVPLSGTVGRSLKPLSLPPNVVQPTGGLCFVGGNHITTPLIVPSNAVIKGPNNLLVTTIKVLCEK